jgi:uncharacterized protein (TIGR00297 family)
MQYWIVGSVVGGITAFLTYKLRSLTLAASLEAAVIVLCACAFGGWFGLVFLLSAYLTIALVDRVLKKRPAQDISKKHGPRDFVQVAANGLPATVCIALFAATGKHAFLMGFAAALTEALADSVASDVGVLSKKDPISLCRFRPVPRGLSGGVSLLGTAASFAATVFCAAIYLAFFRSLAGAGLLVLCGNLGCLIDSLLGDLLQEKFRCAQCGRMTEKTTHCGLPTRRVAGIPHLDNCLVNLISNTLTAALAVVLLIW